MTGTIAKNVELNQVMQESLQTINKIQNINELEKRKDKKKKPELLLRRDVEGKEKKETYLLNNIIEEKPLCEANKLKLGKKYKEKKKLPKTINKIFFTNIGKNTNVSVFKPKEEIEKEKIEKEGEEKDKLEKEKYLITREIIIETIFDTFKKEVNQEEGIGTINELYDSKPPYKAGGTFSQAWSVSEIIKIVSKRNG